MVVVRIRCVVCPPGVQPANAEGKIEDYRDVESLNYYARAVARGEKPERVLSGLMRMSRDHARTPVQWDASANAGFSTVVPWIAVNPNHRHVNAQAQYGDTASVFSHYRALIALRHRLAVVVDGDFERLDVGAPAMFAVRRTLGAQRLLVIANLSSSAVTPHLPEAERDYWRDERPILNNVDGEDRADAALSPWEAKVYAR